LRNKRLEQDKNLMEGLNEKSNLLEIQHSGDLPEKYIVTYYCRSLIWFEGNHLPSYSCRHQFEIYLHRCYPGSLPLLRCLTNIFHPNILSNQNGGSVCIVSWSPTDTLDILCVRLGEMLQYKTYNLINPINSKAALWIQKHLNKLPTDKRMIIG
jgi:ubiquitin-protein ligase